MPAEPIPDTTDTRAAAVARLTRFLTELMGDNRYGGDQFDIPGMAADIVDDPAVVLAAIGANRVGYIGRERGMSRNSDPVFIASTDKALADLWHLLRPRPGALS